MHSENPKPVVSVLLPIGRTFDRVFSDAILPCATELRMQTARVSTEFSSAGALARVHEQIQSSELIVADLTGRNPNVLYLVGYAHAAGKKVIFLSQHGEDLPFCRAEHAIIIYAGSTSELAAELRITIQQLNEAASRSGEGNA